MAAERPFRLLIVSHAADRTGAPISTLALTKAWAAREDVEVKVLLRRDGPLKAAYSELAETFVYRAQPPHFHISDAIGMVHKNGLALTAKGLRNPDRPYVQSAHTYLTGLNIGRHLRQWQPDAIYASTTHCGDAIEPMGLEAPILTHVREMRGVIAALDKRRRAFALHKSAAFAAVSEPVHDTLVEDWRINPSIITIEPPAIELETVLQGASSNASPHARPFILGIGSLIPRKGPDLFLQAAKAAIEAGSPQDFIWLGDGEMRAQLLVQTEAFRLKERVFWLGQVENPYPYLRAASALAMTSREDPHPRTMIEAAALGTPIVAFTGSGGADTFIPENAAGKLVPIGDIKALSKALLAADLPRPDAQAIQNKYDVEASAHRLLAQLKALAV